ncbi:single-stranded nucleic acid binding protein [Favolaschia claudopus]|uniref:Probable RNA-binding protein 18 n=1 Tax=Favolaschia claudopus TaxID=2862362 RepID=A0AAW0D2P4_9AGAR
MDIEAEASFDTPQDDSLDHYLSHPTHIEEPLPQASSSTLAAQSRQLLQDRLYVGNLHPTVDEYSLLQIFSRFGRITHLDFLFHKAGVLKGKPRGYAFVEYGSKDDALRALSTTHNKLLRGRKLVVTLAQQAPIDLSAPTTGSSRHRKIMAESGRPTTLSMIKSGPGNRNEGTSDKIAMMEAKLRQMERTKSSETHSSSSSLPYNPSLPAKPIPSDSSLASQFGRTPNEMQRTAQRRSAPLLPSLPVHSRAVEPKGLRTLSSGPKGTGSTRKAGALTGIKLGKPKEKIAQKDVPNSNQDDGPSIPPGS